jgi:serine/threonine protein kinase
VIKALHFLEMQNIVHRDIKPDNILINDSVQIKVCDFGISGNLTDDQYDFAIVVATNEYLSPVPERRTIQRDMWALGITLLEMITGKHPFSHANDFSLSVAIEQWDRTVPTAVSVDLQDLFLQL